MLSTPKGKGDLFLASSLCDGLEDNNIRQVATLLLSKDADPNVIIPTHGVTPFHLVIGNDSEEFAEEVTKLFLRHGGNPNVRSNDGMTPVHVAAAWGRLNILQLLLANGGDPLCLDNDGHSPFHFAFDGKYFKALTMLSNYCLTFQDEDNKPKFNIALDKVLVTNGDVVAEYIALKEMDLDGDITTGKSTLVDFSSCKPNSSSMIVDTSHATGLCNNTVGSKFKSLENPNEYLFKDSDVETAHLGDDQSETRESSTRESNYSFIDLDFDFANLCLSDAVRKEKCLVSQIINRLSSSVSNCNINETLNVYKKSNQQERSVTSNSSASHQLKENEDVLHKRKYYKTSKSTLCKPKRKCVKGILKSGTPAAKTQCNSKQSTSKKRHKKVSSKTPLTPTHIFDNSIVVGMSPNLKTPDQGTKRKIANTSLLVNDDIISMSPNFTTPERTNKRLNLKKRLSIDDSSFQEMLKNTQKYKSLMQQPEYNWHRKRIAQSTPRRKRRSIYKYSRRQIFHPYLYESDVTSDEFTGNNRLKPIDLNKTIFSETDTLDTSNECSSINFHELSKSGQRNCDYNRFKINLDNERYDRNEKSFSEMGKEKLVNYFGGNDRYKKPVSFTQVNDKYVTIRKDIFKIDKEAKAVDISPKKSTSTTESDSSHRERFVDCVGCDTKKLLNEDLNVNISKICNVHSKNWCSHKLSEALSHKWDRQACLSSHSRLLGFSKLSKHTTESKGRETEDIFKAEDSDVRQSEKNSSLLSFVSTQEEYKYEDLEEDVVLLERRLCVTPFSGSECDIKNKMTISDASSPISVSQNLPLYIDDVTLRKELRQFGDHPGPITSTTRQIYLRRLMRLKNVRDGNISLTPPLVPKTRKNHAELSKRIKSHLEFGNWLNHLDIYRSLEKHVFEEFASPDPSRRWREGTSKMSFTYLLLDPRVTQDLPNRRAHLIESEVWSIFLSSIFYIGKGKRSRPFDHLYDAYKTWSGKSSIRNKKIDYILDIWDSDHGVVCLHIFQNIIPVEAYTREAAMIDAIGRERLLNCKSGEYYGVAATWSVQQKQNFGRYLLYKALQIYMQEGESQLSPYNLHV